MVEQLPHHLQPNLLREETTPMIQKEGKVHHYCLPLKMGGGWACHYLGKRCGSQQQCTLSFQMLFASCYLNQKKVAPLPWWLSPPSHCLPSMRNMRITVRNIGYTYIITKLLDSHEYLFLRSSRHPSLVLRQFSVLLWMLFRWEWEVVFALHFNTWGWWPQT